MFSELAHCIICNVHKYRHLYLIITVSTAHTLPTDTADQLGSLSLSEHVVRGPGFGDADGDAAGITGNERRQNYVL